MDGGGGEGLPARGGAVPGDGAAAVSRPGVSVWDEGVAAWLVGEVAAGRSLSAICREEARAPHRTTVRNWAAARPAFGQALAVAQRTARLAARMRDVEAARARALAPPPAKGGQESAYTDAAAEAICERLANGESLLAIARDPEMPRPGTVYKWARMRPAFGARLAEARAAHADYLFDEAREVALGATPETVAADRLRFDTIRWQAAKLRPRKYAEPLVVALEKDAAEREQRVTTIRVVKFMEGPDGRVLVAPPRNADEDQAWLESTGKPYDGPRFRTEPGAALYGEDEED